MTNIIKFRSSDETLDDYQKVLGVAWEEYRTARKDELAAEDDFWNASKELVKSIVSLEDTLKTDDEELREKAYDVFLVNKRSSSKCFQRLVSAEKLAREKLKDIDTSLEFNWISKWINDKEEGYRKNG